MSNVLIEFTQATDKRAKGERVYVDEASARSLVKVKKHARVITEKDLAAEARRAASGQPVEDDVDDVDETGEADSTEQADTTTPAGGAS